MCLSHTILEMLHLHRFICLTVYCNSKHVNSSTGLGQGTANSIILFLKRQTTYVWEMETYTSLQLVFEAMTFQD